MLDALTYSHADDHIVATLKTHVTFIKIESFQQSSKSSHAHDNVVYI